MNSCDQCGANPFSDPCSCEFWAIVDYNWSQEEYNQLVRESNVMIYGENNRESELEA